MTCLFNRAHTNISLTRFREHLRGCKERIKLTQSMLDSDDEERVKTARKTTRAKGKSYREGYVYISSRHKDSGRMEVCHYDARHHIISSNTKYHCGDCCARISKRSNSTENSGGGPDYCWWPEMATDCPGQHTPMEHHHVHGCVNYDTRKPNAPRKRLMDELGLNTRGGPSRTTTSTAAESTDYTSSSNHQNLNSSNNNSSSNKNPTRGNDTGTSPTYISKSDENSTPSASPGTELQQGNDSRDHSDDTREGADSGPSLVMVQLPTPVTEKPQSPATPPVVPDHPPKLSHGPTLHHPTNNPTQAKWEQHDSTTTTHRTTVISSLVQKLKKLNRTTMHTHGCVDYETGNPKAPRERLRRDWGLDITGGTSGAATRQYGSCIDRLYQQQ
jgi:hypothetical protein